MKYRVLVNREKFSAVVSVEWNKWFIGVGHSESDPGYDPHVRSLVAQLGPFALHLNLILS